MIPHSFPFESAQKRIALTHEIKKQILEQSEVDSLSHSNLPIALNRLRKLTIDKSGETINYYVNRVDQNYFGLIGQRLIKSDTFSIDDIRNNNRLNTGEVDENMNEVAIVNHWQNYLNLMGKLLVCILILNKKPLQKL